MSFEPWLLLLLASTALGGLPAGTALIFCDEAGDARPAAALMADLKGRDAALLIGPEGGFTPEERAFLRSRPGTHPVSLGPRILRAETAAIAAMALWQAVCGDWG